MLEKMDVLQALLHGYEWSKFRTGGHKMLAGAGDHVLGLAPSKPGGERDGKKRFADNALELGQAFILCRTLGKAKALRDEEAQESLDTSDAA